MSLSKGLDADFFEIVESQLHQDRTVDVIHLEAFND